MNRLELVRLLAEMARRWPDFDADDMAPGTLATYAEDLATIPLENAAEAVRGWARQGRMKPPTAGQIYREVAKERPALTSPQPYSGPRCTCHIAPGWRECKYSHTEEWLANRRADDVDRALHAIRREYAKIPDPRSQYSDRNFDPNAWRSNRDAVLADRAKGPDA